MATQWGLSIVDIAAAILGLMVAFSIWRDKHESSTFEKNFLEQVWHWDGFYDATIGRPLTASARVGYAVVEEKAIDGAVEGVGALAPRMASQFKLLQTGFVRQYALAMVLGIALIMTYLVARIGF